MGMGWVSSGNDRKATIGVLPELATTFTALYQSLWTQPHLPPEVLELCRLRLAQLHQCVVELQRQDCDISAEKCNNLIHWNTHSAFSTAERACLAFTEVYAMDAQALTDTLAAHVKTHFGDAGLVLLVEALGIFDGMTRLSLLWQLPATASEQTAQGRVL
jgi:alkylhydroperoxidase family enzyme